MAKYSRKIVKDIADIIAKENPTINEICQRLGIHRSTYFEWVKTKPDLSDIISKAKKEHNQLLVAEARRSLLQLARGYEIEEVKTVYGRNGADGKPQIKEQVRTKKHVPPSVGAVIFTLVNRDPDNWKNKQQLDGKLGLEHRLTNLTDTQLNEVIDNVLNSSADD